MIEEDIIKLAKSIVCSQLKSPASAQFSDDLISITKENIEGTDRYKVTGFVDSQNSYGEMIRNDFVVIIRIIDDIPKVTGCFVGNETDANNRKNFLLLFIIISILTSIGGALLFLLDDFFVGLFF